MSFLLFLRAQWPWLRWVLLVLGLAALLGTAAQLVSYVTARRAQHHGLRRVQARLQQHAARQQADGRLIAVADSQYFTLEGQRRQADSAAALLKTRYDAHLSRLPAAPVLPARPPRYRPNRR